MNGFFVLLPSLNVMGVNNTVLGWTALVGGTIFELGSYLLVLEALNRKQVVCLVPWVLLTKALFRRCLSNSYRPLYSSIPQSRETFPGKGIPSSTKLDLVWCSLD